MPPDRSPRHSRLDRRALLQGSAAAGSAALIGRDATAAAAQAGSPGATPTVSPINGVFDMLAVTVADLRVGLDAGEFTSRDIVQAALDRIAQLDGTLHAVTQLNPAALDEADALDAELADTGPRSPMHGIPVILKDNIAIGGMENTAGSLAMVGALPTRDAFLVERLREVGAVILGKANLSEWANIRSPRSSSGWSGVGGQTANPHQTDRSPSGSSSGSAVAVAAGYVTVSLGTETDGSIVSPANCCGVVGIKPTVGLTSRMGVIPISHHQDTVGPFGRTVADAAALLTAIAVPDPDDPAVASRADGSGAVQATLVASPVASPTAEAAQPSYPRRPADAGSEAVNYISPEVLDADGLQGARIGVWRETAGYNYTTDAAFEAALAALTEAGADLVDPVAMPSFADVTGAPDELNVLLWELKPGLAGYIEGYVDPSFPIRTLADVVAFNEENAETSMPWFRQEFLQQSVGMTGLDDPEYLATVARTQRWGREEGIDAVLREHDLDAIIAPTGQPAWKIDLVTGDNFRGASSSASAIAGYPIVSVPAGSGNGLPVNVSFIGGAFSEATLIRLAYAFEQATQARIDPALLPPAVIPPLD